MFKRPNGGAKPSSTSPAPTSDTDPVPARINTFDRYATMMLAVTAGSLPLYVVRWKYGPISTTLLELLVLATISLYLLGRRQAGAFGLNRTPYDIPIALLLVAGAMAVLVPPDRWHAALRPAWE